MTRVKRKRRIDEQGRGLVTIHPPDEWSDLDSDLPDSMADWIVQELRAAGGFCWLRAMPDGTVRTRLMLAQEPPPQLLRLLAKHARPLGKAIARSGEWDPPPGNPFGDKPLPPGGHWRWD